MHESDEPRPEIDVVEAAYDALDAGDPETALSLIGRALVADADDPVLHFLLGVARLELDDPVAAVEPLERAVAIDPDDAEFRARLAETLYRCCRFEDAAPHARSATDSDPRLALGHHVAGLLAERRGRNDEADAAFARATKLEPEAFPRPVRLDENAFARHLAEAIDRLPSPFRDALAGVAVTVESVPDEALLLDAHPPLDPELLGLFAGLPLPDRGPLGPGGELPGRIYLFQRSLERFAEDEDDLVEQIGVTLRHELGHYLGLDEEEIEAAGHG